MSTGFACSPKPVASAEGSPRDCPCWKRRSRSLPLRAPSIVFPSSCRIKGELLLRLNSPDQSPEGCFHEALRLAGDQGAKSLELKAAISLARLYRSEGQDRAARDVLVPAYTWFTEGHETSDLAEAKELLDQLR